MTGLLSSMGRDCLLVLCGAVHLFEDERSVLVFVVVVNHARRCD